MKVSSYKEMYDKSMERYGFLPIYHSGIKCDFCDYRDDSVKMQDLDKYLHINCPKCGKPLFTQKAYDKCIRFFNKALNVMEIAERMGCNIKPHKDDKNVTIPLDNDCKPIFSKMTIK